MNRKSVFMVLLVCLLALAFVGCGANPKALAKQVWDLQMDTVANPQKATGNAKRMEALSKQVARLSPADRQVFTEEMVRLVGQFPEALSVAATDLGGIVGRALGDILSGGGGGGSSGGGGQLNGTAWRDNREDYTEVRFSGNAFEMKPYDNALFARGTYSASTGDDSTSVSIAITELHADFWNGLLENEIPGIKIKSNWYNGSQIRDAFAAAAKDCGLSDTIVSAYLNAINFEAAFTTMRGRINGDTMILGDTQYARVGRR